MRIAEGLSVDIISPVEDRPFVLSPQNLDCDFMLSKALFLRINSLENYILYRLKYTKLNKKSIHKLITTFEKTLFSLVNQKQTIKSINDKPIRQ